MLLSPVDAHFVWVLYGRVCVTFCSPHWQAGTNQRDSQVLQTAQLRVVESRLKPYCPSLVPALYMLPPPHTDWCIYQTLFETAKEPHSFLDGHPHNLVLVVISQSPKDR